MDPMRPHSRHLLASVAALLSLAGCSSSVSSVTGSVDGGGDAEVSLPDVATPTDAPLSCASEARSSAAIRYTGPDEVAWDCRATRPTDEPNLASAGRDTNRIASHQGTGREPKADRPGRTKAVVATHSTAGQGETLDRTRGEPRPKGPTIKAIRLREGNAGHDVWAKERQEGH